MSKRHAIRIEDEVWEELERRAKETLGKSPADLARDYILEGMKCDQKNG